MPTFYKPVLYVLDEIERLRAVMPEPVLVHCDRGLGPTGVFIAFYYCVKKVHVLGGVMRLASSNDMC